MFKSINITDPTVRMILQVIKWHFQWHIVVGSHSCDLLDGRQSAQLARAAAFLAFVRLRAVHLYRRQARLHRARPSQPRLFLLGLLEVDCLSRSPEKRLPSLERGSRVLHILVVVTLCRFGRLVKVQFEPRVLHRCLYVEARRHVLVEQLAHQICALSRNATLLQELIRRIVMHDAML